MQILGGVDPGVSVPQNAPTSLSATAVNTSVDISFTAPTNDGGSPITNYEYSFDNSSWTALSPTDATTPVTVSSLTQNTSYTVYLRAVNIVGSGPASTGVSFTTQGVPTSAPTSLSAIQTDTSVAISFTAAASSTALTNYEYSFNNSSWTALSPADAVSPITISGLAQNTAYSVYLRGVNAYGSGPGSTAVSFTTFGPPTGTTTITSISSIGVTTATVNFSTTAGGSAITGYDYYLSSWVDAGVSSSPKALSGLSSYTAYTVYMRPKNAYGVGPQSAGVGFTTLAQFNVDFLVVAGGGSGGSARGGGGGAGGYRTSAGTSGGNAGAESAITVTSGGNTYSVTVGGGGNQGNGGNSAFHTVTSTGGGRGGANNATGAAGGSGGGGGGSSGTGGAGTGSQGTNGRNAAGVRAGGGGGASVGGGTNEDGGAGLASTITGSSVNYAGGGGGGSNSGYLPGNDNSTWGGGDGGGGSDQGLPGTNGKGGGGGGAGQSSAGVGATGGSGVVVIRYAATQPSASATTGSPTFSNDGTYKRYTWTGSGSITF